MHNEPTLEKLKMLRLNGLAAAWDEQQRSPGVGSLSFDERLGMLIDAEWTSRENKKISRSLKEAKLRLTEACIEAIEYPAKRELDKAVVRQLQTCRWVTEHQSVLITGATGTGKSYIACALANQACRRGFRAIYRRAPRLFDELKLARADGTYRTVLAKLARVDVLIIDDFAVAPISDSERSDLLEVMEDRYGLKSTIVASQLPPTHWHDYLSDPTLADAICDRLVNNAHRLMLKGPSKRKEKESTQEP
ncbi:MAG: ATP-binding protein [Gemmatimonadaceae bacterium]|nr:ATP-binding protein [Gemmatimonadaceae bacterium]